jgi:PLP dependent protein
MYEYITANLNAIKEKVNRAAAEAGSRPENIRIIGVAKTFTPEAIKAAIQAGITDIGESRVQEAEPKMATLGKTARWHMIGHLQTNKVKKAIEIFDMI